MKKRERCITRRELDERMEKEMRNLDSLWDARIKESRNNVIVIEKVGEDKHKIYNIKECCGDDEKGAFLQCTTDLEYALEFATGQHAEYGIVYKDLTGK